MILYKLLEYSQVVRRSFLVRIFKGSNPFIPKFKAFNILRRMAEWFKAEIC